MERNINYTLIGGIFFVLLLCMIVFIFWLGRIGVDDNKFRTYYVYTDKSVDGLSINTPVKYKGINIGSITKIDFDKDKLGIVKIDLAINSSIPIHKDSTVVLDSQGLAGLSYLALKQNSQTKDFILKNDEPILKFQQNFIGQITSKADLATKEFLEVLKNVKNLTSPENVENISSIIKSLNSLTASLNQATSHIDSFSKNSNKLLVDLDNKLNSGEYDMKSILNPIALQLEVSLKNMNVFFEKGTNLLNKFNNDPYNTIFGEQKR